MSTLADSLRIPIDTSSYDNRGKPKSDLQSRVLQIIQQKGHFRHVTEQSLLSEEDSDTENEEAKEPDDEEDTIQNQDEKLVKSRDDMLRQLDRAQNDTLVALETISFLLSKTSSSAQSTMSEELRKRAPVGTLETRVVQARPSSEMKAKQLALNSQGWRSQTFHSVSQSLSLASDRLRKESQLESEYWQQIANLKENGITISRHPREGSAVSVHFGSANSAAQFRNRGIGFLRQDTTRNVYLDQGPATRRSRRLQVQIHRGSNISGSYSFRTVPASEGNDITQTIFTARDCLSEEELFYEISREARITANQGITTKGQTVSFDVGKEYDVSLSLNSSSSDADPSQSEDNVLAEYIGLSLRSLLQQAHAESYQRRTRTPPPLLPKPSQISERAILRPLVSKIRHNVAVHELRCSLGKEVLEPVRRAGLDIDWQDAYRENNESLAEPNADQSISSNKPCQSCFNLILPTQQRVQVTLTSLLGSPIYGTQYEISGLVYDFARMQTAFYHDYDTVLGALLGLLKLDLVALAASIRGNTSKSAGSAVNGESSRTWQISRPHNGELSLLSQNSAKPIAAMRIDIGDGALGLRLAPATLEYQKQRKILNWCWSRRGIPNQPMLTGNPEDVEIKKSVAEKANFSEVVRLSLGLAI